MRKMLLGPLLSHLCHATKYGNALVTLLVNILRIFRLQIASSALEAVNVEKFFREKGEISNCLQSACFIKQEIALPKDENNKHLTYAPE